MSETEPQRQEQEQAERPERELPEKPTPEQMAEVEKLLQQASVARIRGQAHIAERALAEAAEVAPGSAAVRAALGDQLWERGQMRKARAEYEMAHLLEPNNPTYETKWAEAILGSSGDPLAGLNETNPYASGKWAALLSVFVPGLGTVALGKTTIGLVMIGTWFGTIAWLAATPDGFYSVFRILGLKAGGGRINDMAMLPFGVLVLTWLWSFIAVVSKAKDVKREKIARPTPPGQGRFD